MFENLELVNIWKQTKCTSSKYVKLKLVTNCKKKKLLQIRKNQISPPDQYEQQLKKIITQKNAHSL